MAEFEKFMPYIFQYEGGYCNDEGDAGGATNYGICLRFAQGTRNMALFDMNGDGAITERDIRALTKDRATEAFRLYFWNKNKVDLENLPNAIAFCVFDASINMGEAQAVKLAQRALYSMGFKLTVDGAAGPVTNKALKEADPKKFVENFTTQKTLFYTGLVAKKPSQKKFLNGWLNRVNDVRKVALGFIEEEA